MPKEPITAWHRPHEIRGTLRNREEPQRSKLHNRQLGEKIKNRGRKKENWEENKDGENYHHEACVFVFLTRNSLSLRGPWMCVKCRDSSEMRSSPGLDTHTFCSSSGRWLQHEVNITTAESATGGSHERSLIFSHQRDTWFILFSRKADNAPMKISGGFHHHYCSPHTIFKCILDYVAM